MSKARVTITVDPHLVSYAERLVELGKAPSVSAAFNDALAERVQRDRRASRWWAERAAEAATDDETATRVSRMKARVDQQLREFAQNQDR